MHNIVEFIIMKDSENFRKGEIYRINSFSKKVTYEITILIRLHDNYTCRVSIRLLQEMLHNKVLLPTKYLGE